MLILTCVSPDLFIYFSLSVKYERIKFLVIALKSSVEVYAWAPKPYHKFMAFKVTALLLPCCYLCPEGGRWAEAVLRWNTRETVLV